MVLAAQARIEIGAVPTSARPRARPQGPPGGENDPESLLAHDVVPVVLLEDLLAVDPEVARQHEVAVRAFVNDVELPE